MNNIDKNNLSHIELSEQYYKSRKQLMLFSGLFFVYEFIGFDVPEKPLANTDIIIKSPQAVPLVLLILVVYFYTDHFWDGNFRTKLSEN